MSQPNSSGASRAQRIAVVGAGLIGARHAGLVAGEPLAELAAVVDPMPAGREVAARLGAPWFDGIDAMLAAIRPDGIIVATPNQLHVEHGLQAVAAGIPLLVEKPIASDVAGATRLVQAAEQARVPILVGHHRRHNPLIQAAREAIETGSLGRVVAVSGHFWAPKPDAYFEAEWRRRAGAGPVFINLIHDVDLLRFLCGEIVSVQAEESHAVRGFDVEDTAALLLRFASGALGSLSASDCVVAPWSWELTAGENPAYPQQDAACYQIAGTLGALALPGLDLWTAGGEPDWTTPLRHGRLAATSSDPLVLQLRHFCAVAAGRAEPLVAGRDGLETLRVIEAAKQAAQTGTRVRIG
jgi:predicted dehydrogenase